MPVAPRAFFNRSCEEIARGLLGWKLLRVLEDGTRLVGRIVETEAYPPGDPSSHAFRRQTLRNAPMFGRPGTAYVYQIYGLYRCMNVVTDPTGVGAAVLIRGLDGIDGCAGPALLCRRLLIDVDLNEIDTLARGSAIRLIPPRAAPPEPVVTTTRIGLSKAVDAPLRFYLLGSPGVSRRNRTAEKESATECTEDRKKTL